MPIPQRPPHAVRPFAVDPGLDDAGAISWWPLLVPSRRYAVNPVRPGREQRQQRTRAPGCGGQGLPPHRSCGRPADRIHRCRVVCYSGHAMNICLPQVDSSCMSYQVLARKWRPKSFRQLVGQEHVSPGPGQRPRPGPGPSCLPVHRHARSGQNDHCPHPRQVPQLRARRLLPALR